MRLSTKGAFGALTVLFWLMVGGSLSFAQEEMEPDISESADEAAASSFIVSVFADEGDPGKSVSGVIVGSGNYILTTSAITDSLSSVHVSFVGVDGVFDAVVDEIDLEKGVSLIRVVDGPASQPVVFANEAPAVGEAVAALYYRSDEGSMARVNGAIGNQLIVPKDGGNVGYWEHNALIPSRGYGGALMNICGEQIALNVVDPIFGRRKARRLQDPEGAVYAFQHSELLSLLSLWGVSPNQSDTSCGPVADVVDDSQRSIEAAKKELEDAKVKAEKAREDAKNAERLAKKQKEEAERLKKDAEATEEEKREAAEAAERAEQMARQAATALADFDQQVAAFQGEITTLTEALAKTERERLYLAVAGLTAVIVVGGLGGYFVRRRSKQLDQANLERHSAEAELARSFPDVECRGVDSAGNPHAFKITGASLVRSPDGVVVGRQPQAANVVLNHPEVSRAHVRLKLGGDQVSIEDMDSTNGTSLNGVSLTSGEPKALRSGDEIALGTLTFKVRFLDD